MLSSKKQQSTAVLLVAMVVLVGIRIFASTDFVADALRPIAEAGSRLHFSSDLTSNSDKNTEAEQLRQENQQLREQLELPKKQPHKTVRAEVIGKNTQSYRRTVRINRGSSSGVEPAKAVLFEGELVGIVDNVSETTALIVLINDPEFRAAAQIGNSGSEGIVKLEASGLVIDRVNRPGDQDVSGSVFTSGLGGVFPPGLYLGELGTELSEPDDIFARYAIKRTLAVSKILTVEVVTQ